MTDNDTQNDFTFTRVALALHDGRITMLEKDNDELWKRDKTFTELLVAIGKLEMQIKVTWGLLMLVIGGLVGVAFSVMG